MTRTFRVLAALVTAIALIAGSAIRNEALAKKEKPPKNAPAPAAGAKPDAAKPGDDKPFDEVVKDMTVTKGLFTFYRRADDNKVLMEILPAQLEKTFLFSGTLRQVFLFQLSRGHRVFPLFVRESVQEFTRGNV